MTQSERELLYRILFENSNEEPTSAIYEVYDALTDFFDNNNLFEIKQETHTIH